MTGTMKAARKSYTFRLKKRPSSFVEGMSSVSDIGGEIIDNYKTEYSDEKADCRSLESDWKAVGEDIWSSMRTYVKEHP